MCKVGKKKVGLFYLWLTHHYSFTVFFFFLSFFLFFLFSKSSFLHWSRLSFLVCRHFCPGASSVQTVWQSSDRYFTFPPPLVLSSFPPRRHSSSIPTPSRLGSLSKIQASFSPCTCIVGPVWILVLTCPIRSMGSDRIIRSIRLLPSFHLHIGNISSIVHSFSKYIFWTRLFPFRCLFILHVIWSTPLLFRIFFFSTHQRSSLA